MKLLTVNNPKAQKSQNFGYLTGILHLLPHKLSGRNVCPKASAGCRAACLNLSGKGRFSKVQNTRLRRTLMYFNHREAFLAHLRSDIYELRFLADELGLKPTVRINGTSDLPALAIRMAEEFPGIQFYDYTKITKTILRDDLPPNYSLTFSRSETNERDAFKVLDAGRNVSVVFDPVLPPTWHGYPVIDGDRHDLRFLDPENVVVGLHPKGTLAKNDTSGFVVRV
ncbi:MAG: hypothetical protein ACK4S4_15570 [Pyrinomonadaceae bacterium]